MPKQNKRCDFLIVGAGIIGLCLARRLKSLFSDSHIIILEKELDSAKHSSGRNSGVMHAGFYYTANSLKAKFTKDGCAHWTKFCDENGLSINKCKKVVVASSEDEIPGIDELYKRGIQNGVDVKIIDEKELREIDPNVVTKEKALYSPSTATIDPIEVCQFLKKQLQSEGVEFIFGNGYHSKIADQAIRTQGGQTIEFGKFINSAGLYADKIARHFGFSQDMTVIPFKGIYLKYKGPGQPLKTNVYPVPNLANPFLGVHFTVTVDNKVKIGPTAIPAFWRENYKGFDNFSASELLEVIYEESKLFMSNSFNFRKLAFEEMRKYNPKYFRGLAGKMVRNVDLDKFTEWTKPGIRSQLLNLKTRELVQDFVVEGDKTSIHILNSVSPAFTSSFPFADHIIQNYIVEK